MRAVRGRRGMPAAWTYLVLLWLAGASQRMTMLAVPPLLPSIHHSLQLSETEVGALSALPILLLAAGAIPGSLLIARIGARRALVLGLIGIAGAGALRGAGTSTMVLFLMTLVMGVGVAVSQPALPSLVRQWLPQKAGLATAIYSNGFLIGELAAVGLTAPLLLSLVGGSWQIALAVWSAPVMLTAAALLIGSRHVRREQGVAVPRWWPDWGDSLTWRLGLILGGACVAYWGTNAFVPDYLRATQRGDLIAPTLTVLNLSQLPASVILASVPQHVVGRRWPVIAAGALTLAGAVGLAFGGPLVIACVALIGFSTASIFVLSLALPPVLTGEHDVHRLSAAMFAIAYACPFIASLLGGAMWDGTGAPLAAFLPVAASGVMMAVMVLGMRLPEEESTHPPTPSPLSPHPPAPILGEGEKG